MSVIEALQSEQVRVQAGQAELAKAQRALDVAGTTLDKADHALERAVVVAEETRRRAPQVAAAVAVVAVVVVALVLWRRRRGQVEHGA